jgi:K+ transporter
MEFKTKADSQSVEDWMKQLGADCLELHKMAKEVVNLPNAVKGYLVQWCLELSDEPQYQMLALMGFYDKVDNERKNLIILKVTSLIDECRTYVKKIKAQTPEDRIIRAVAEWGYRTGQSVSEIVDICIDGGMLLESDEDSAYRANHERRIQRYIKTFPSFQKKENQKPRVEKLIEFLNQGIKKTH